MRPVVAGLLYGTGEDYVFATAAPFKMVQMVGHLVRAPRPSAGRGARRGLRLEMVLSPCVGPCVNAPDLG